MNTLYLMTLYPVELFYEYIYVYLYHFIKDYGLALLALSIVNYVLLLPLNTLVAKVQKREKDLQSVIEPQLKKIKLESKGQELHKRVMHLYKRYSYHPIFAIRSSFRLIIQLPFLMAVYYMLSGFTDISGKSFLFIQNLGTPDRLLNGINVLPIVMTIISVAAAFTTRGIAKKERNQAILIAFVFLVLLYSAPSALLIYWTCNNILTLLVNFIPKKFLQTSCCVYIYNLIKATKQRPSFFTNSATVFLPLVFFLPVYFLIVQNLHMFQLLDVYEVVIFMLTLCIFLGFLGFVVDMAIMALNPYAIKCKIPLGKARVLPVKLSSQLVVYAAVLAFCIQGILNTTIDYKNYFSTAEEILFFNVSLFILGFILLAKFNFKYINILFLIIICITTARLPIAVMDYYNISMSYSFFKEDLEEKEKEQIIKAAFDAFPFDSDLKNKPNIYLFLLESYHGFLTQKNTFGIDTIPMENALKKENFITYNNVYANTPGTIQSLFTLCTMQDQWHMFTRGQSDASTFMRKLIAGSTSNPLYTFFKEQGYYISTNLPNYAIQSKEPLLDYATALLDKKHSSLHNVLAQVSSRLLSYLPEYNKSDASGDVFDTQNLPTNDKPLFAIIYLDKLHIKLSFEGNAFLPNTYADLIKTKAYQSDMEKANAEILHYINEIISKDPNALIILVGDHGYRYAIHQKNPIGDRYTLTASELAQDVSIKMTPEEVAIDSYGTMLAVRMPEYAQQDIGFGKVLSHANIFKHVFAALERNSIFLKELSPNISRTFSGKPSVVEGEVVKKDESFNFTTWENKETSFNFRIHNRNKHMLGGESSSVSYNSHTDTFFAHTGLEVPAKIAIHMPNISKIFAENSTPEECTLGDGVQFLFISRDGEEMSFDLPYKEKIDVDISSLSNKEVTLIIDKKDNVLCDAVYFRFE